MDRTLLKKVYKMWCKNFQALPSNHILHFGSFLASHYNISKQKLTFKNHKITWSIKAWSMCRLDVLGTKSGDSRKRRKNS